jgi:hypothetical protein
MGLGFTAWMVMMPLDARRFGWTPPVSPWLRAAGGTLLQGSSFLRHKLAPTPILSAGDALKQSAQVTRLFRPLHAHRLIAKIPHSRRWPVSLSGRRVMAAALKLREVAYPSLYADAA